MLRNVVMFVLFDVVLSCKFVSLISLSLINTSAMMNGNMQDAYADIRLFDYAYSLSHALSPNRRDINLIKKYNV